MQHGRAGSRVPKSDFSISESEVPATRWISELTLLTVASVFGSSAASVLPRMPRRRAAQIGDVVADEVADPSLDFRDRGEILVLVNRIDFFRTD